MNARTLQRHLAQMIASGKIQLIGQGRNIRYEITTHQSETFPEMTASTEFPIPLSKEGDEIRQYVEQKIQYRTPAGYNKNFLEEYQPNQTFYLPENVRSQFHKEGILNHSHEPGSTYSRKMLSRLLIDLSFNSSRLEGNTYSLLETGHLLMDGKQAVSKTVYHPPEIPQLIEECFYKILHKAKLITDPFEQAFFTMVHLPYLQPFEDVNKRVSRLAANIPFIKHHLCPLSFIHVPERAYIDGTLGVYECRRIELLRDVFIFAYERAIK